MSRWWEGGGLVPFDTETTGIDPTEDRIVTAYLDGRSWLICPEIEIPEEATKIHGITQARANAEGGPPDESIEQIVEAMRGVADTGRVLVGSNLAFDLTILDREAARYGLHLPHGLWCVDVLVLDKRFDQYRKGSRRLDALAAQYGVTQGEWHEAAGDAETAALVARVILDRMAEAQDGPMYDPFVLHHLQVQWRWEQQESLRRYFDEKGTPHDGVPGYWPVIPRGRHWWNAAAPTDTTKET